jgi:hypothetical protein
MQCTSPTPAATTREAENARADPALRDCAAESGAPGAVGVLCCVLWKNVKSAVGNAKHFLPPHLVEVK